MSRELITDHPSEQLWQQLAPQRLRLQDTVSIDCLSYRGRNWYLLRNQLDRQQIRVNERTQQVLSRLDGQRTLAQAVESQLSGDADATTRQGLLGILLQLHAAEMLTSDLPQDMQALVAQQRRRRRQRVRSRWFRLLSPRLPLFDPDRFLSRTLFRVSWLLHPAMLCIWLLFVLAAGLAALMHWDALALYGAQRIDDPRSWLLLVCLYPLIKGLHELGHGYTAKAGGAAVNEMGVTFLVFVPVPFVDASEATVLPSKYRRMLVGAAGIIVELLLATLALFIWLSLGDGLARDVAFAVMLIGGVSTLLFNGNPLLRFDGYFVLTDAIEIPNLATRSARYYGYLFKRYLLGLTLTKAPATAPGERRWFLVYGAASTLYRLVISIGIALFLVNTVPVLGGLLAVWLLVVQLLLPLGRQLNFLLFNQTLTGKRLLVWMRILILAAVPVAVVTLVPFPQRTSVAGVVLMPEQAVIRAEVDGFLRQQAVADNTLVKRGDVLFTLNDPQLDADIVELKARVREMHARRDALGLDRRLEREIQTQRLAEAGADLVELEQRHTALTLVSPIDGIVRIPLSQDHLGRLIRQGDLLAYVADRNSARIRVAATQEDATKIRAAVQRINVRFTDPASPELRGELQHEVPAASDTLPSAALGSRGGGSIMVDARDDQGLKTLHNVYAFEISVPYTPSTDYIGRRALVRFEHPSTPLYYDIKDGIRRFILDEIGE